MNCNGAEHKQSQNRHRVIHRQNSHPQAKSTPLYTQRDGNDLAWDGDRQGLSTLPETCRQPILSHKTWT